MFNLWTPCQVVETSQVPGNNGENITSVSTVLLMFRGSRTRFERFTEAILVFILRVYVLDQPGGSLPLPGNQTKLLFYWFPSVRGFDAISVALIFKALWSHLKPDLCKINLTVRESVIMISDTCVLSVISPSSREADGKRGTKVRVRGGWERKISGEEWRRGREGAGGEEWRERRKVECKTWSEDRDRQGRRRERVINHPVWHSQLQGSFTVQHSLLLAVH